MQRPTEGFKSEALRAALQAAVRGDSRALEQLLCKFGGMPGPRPNLKLAAAFAAELARETVPVTRLLEAFSADDAAPDTPRVILPIAAAFAWVEQISAGREREGAWRALQLLAADERAPVRIACLAALHRYNTSAAAAQQLLELASSWLEQEDRELRFGATAVMIDALTDAQALGAMPEPPELCELLTRAIDDAADASRAAQRSAARRRLLITLAVASARCVAGLRGGAAWFRSECERAEHPDIREMLSEALQQLANLRNAPARAQIDELRAALAGSAKPLRDAARVRPGTGRGRRSRQLR